MKKMKIMNKLFWTLIIFSLISCSKNESTPQEEIELIPEIKLTIEPDYEIISYNTDITINWSITNATTATLNGETINLSGGKLFSNMKQTQDFTIIANNISETATFTKTATIADAPMSPLSFDVIFTNSNRYFSSDGSMNNPVNETSALGIVNKIDITYIYNNDYSEPGFMDPLARTQEYYWNDYYEPWLTDAVETIYYKTNLGKEDFDLAKTDESKINEFFSDNTIMEIAPHAIFPTGSCIGGRQSHNPDSELLGKYLIFGFKNKVSEKKGLIFIHSNQDTGWPLALISHNTRVQIIREN